MARSIKTPAPVAAPVDRVKLVVERINPENIRGVKLGVGVVQDPTEDRRFKGNAHLPSLTKSQRRAIRAARAAALAAVETSKNVKTERKTRNATRNAKAAPTK